ncbi:hypothetical protein A2U01_0110344, partial [Trifolium medium]|nr:hypothetical protein [Trifolium medium]
MSERCNQFCAGADSGWWLVGGGSRSLWV